MSLKGKIFTAPVIAIAFMAASVFVGTVALEKQKNFYEHEYTKALSGLDSLSSFYLNASSVKSNLYRIFSQQGNIEPDEIQLLVDEINFQVRELSKQFDEVKHNIAGETVENDMTVFSQSVKEAVSMVRFDMVTALLLMENVNTSYDRLEKNLKKSFEKLKSDKIDNSIINETGRLFSILFYLGVALSLAIAVSCYKSLFSSFMFIRKNIENMLLGRFEKTESEVCCDRETVEIASLLNSMKDSFSDAYISSKAFEISKNLKNTDDFYMELLSSAVNILGGGLGIIYKKEKTGFRAEVVSGFEAENRSFNIPDYAKHAFDENKISVIHDVPEDYYKIQSSLGESVPQNIVFIPFNYKDKKFGVMELAVFEKIEDRHISQVQGIFSLCKLGKHEPVEHIKKENKEDKKAKENKKKAKKKNINENQPQLFSDTPQIPANKKTLREKPPVKNKDRQIEKTLLVVDDDPDFSENISNFMSEKGINCIVAADGMTGLKMATEYIPDAIIINTELPIKSGKEVIAELKKAKGTSAIPVYVVSDDIATVENIDKTGILDKPATEKQLEAVIVSINGKTGKSAKTESRDVADISLKNRKILIAGNDMNRNFLTLKLLKAEGMKVFMAKNGSYALEMLDKNKGIDVVLMDMEMPEKNGYEVTQEIRSKTEALPVIAITENNDETAINKAVSVGSNVCVDKNFDSEILIETIKQQLGK